MKGGGTWNVHWKGSGCPTNAPVTRYDVEYINRMGFWLDVKLLMLSVRNTLLARWDRRVGKVANSSLQPVESRRDGMDQEPTSPDRAGTLSS